MLDYLRLFVEYLGVILAAYLRFFAVVRLFEAVCCYLSFLLHGSATIESLKLQKRTSLATRSAPPHPQPPRRLGARPDD